MSWTRAFAGRRCLITGGSSGIGKALARLLVQAGARVAITARGADRLEAAWAELAALAPDAGERVVARSLDLRDAEAVAGCAGPLLDALGGLDLLVNNAGIARPGRFAELDEGVFRELMETNYFGAVRMTRAFHAHFVAQGSGHVSFVSSMAGFLGIYGYTAYAPTKFALVGFAECLRQELLAHGVGVSILYPPDTDTPQLAGEARFKPAETQAIAGKAKVLAPEAVARAHLRGIAAGKLHILPGADAKFVHALQRHLPGVVRWAIDRPCRAIARRAAQRDEA